MARWLAIVVCVACSMGVSAQGIFSANPTGLDTAANQAKPGTAVITGRVLAGDDGAPIAAAIVTISAGPAVRLEQASVLTDTQGRFIYTALSPGSYTLTASKPGWLPGGYGRGRPGGTNLPVVITDGQRQGNIDIPLWRFAVITGRVTDGSGDPMVQVDVRAFRLSYIGGHARPTFVTRAWSDDRGIYRFSSLEPGEYLICVPATVTSEPSGLAGVISDRRETPRTYLQTMTAVGTAPMTLDRSTGASGVDWWGVSSPLAMPGSPPSSGRWMTYATTCAPSATSRATATVVKAASGREQAGADIVVRLTTTFRISGTLNGPEGPAAYHAVHLLQADAADMPTADTATAITDSTGTFEFFGVPAGAYIARVVRTPWPDGTGRLGVFGGTGAIPNVGTILDGPGQTGPPPVPTEPLWHASQAVTVTDRDVANLAITMQAGPRVRGRLQFDGSAAPPAAAAIQNLAIVLEPADGQAVPMNTTPGRANAAGEFTTPSLWPGRYLIRVLGLPAAWFRKSAMVGAVDAAETPIDITTDLDNVVITFTDKPAKVTGTIQPPAMRSSGAQAPAPAVVLLFPAGREGWIDYGRATRRLQAVNVSAPGSFSMTAPPDGEYLIVAIPDAEAVDWQNPAILARLAGLAERLTIRDGQSRAPALPVRSLK